MKKLILLFPVFFLLFIPMASGLQTPNVTLIPARISADSSFLAVANSGGTGSIRVTWLVPGLNYAYGSFPKIGEKWFCFFSDSSKSTCGPTPFTLPTGTGPPYTMTLVSVDKNGDNASADVNIDVGGITLTPGVLVQNNTAYMTVGWSGDITGISYAVYYADNATPVPFKSGSLDYNPPLHGTYAYVGDVELDPGDFYIAFSTTGGTDFGGAVEQVTIPIPIEQLQCAECPECPGLDEYPLEVDGVSLDVWIKANEEIRHKVLGITNKGNATLSNLKVSVPENVSSYLSVVLGSTKISPNDTIEYTIVLNDIDTRMGINTEVNITSGSKIVGVIPIDMGISIRDSTSGCLTPSTPGTLVITPSTWYGDYITTEGISESFTITNNAEKALSTINYSVSDDLMTVASVSVPSLLSSGGSGTISVSLSNPYPSSYFGEVIINTDIGSESILVGLIVHEDISSTISAAGDEFDSFTAALPAAQQTQLSGIIDTVNGLLTSAESEFGLGNYNSANEDLEKAQAQISLLKSVKNYMGAGQACPACPSGGGVDMTIILVIALVVLAVIGLWFYFTKMKSKGGRTLEEELEEEF